MAASQILTFHGNCAFEQASEPVWSTDSYGLDTARVPWQGAVTLKKAFEDRLPKFQAMPGYPRMYLLGHSDDGGRVFPIVDLAYSGVKGAIAPAKGEDSLALQTVTTSVVPTSGEYSGKTLTMEATYKASRTTWKWYELQKPARKPRYSTVRNPVDPLGEGLISWRITTDKGSRGTIPYSNFIQLLNGLSRELSVTEYAIEDITPNTIWGCTSVVDYVLKGS